MRSFLTIVFAGFAMFPLYASPIQEIAFSHKDWSLACYSSGTCQATGEGAAKSEFRIQLTRNAGPYQALSAKVQISGSGRVEAYINQRSVGEVLQDSDELILSPPQVTALLDALKQDLTIEFAAGGQRYVLSSSGSNAVLLKMDEFQGRLNTPGALIRPGNKDESTVPAAPHIKTAAELDIIDQQALQQLNTILTGLQQDNAELLLSSVDKALNQLQVSAGVTKFTLDYDSEEPLSRNRPSPDITQDEWQAFLRTNLLTAAGEARKADFMLIDLDGDGKRDLIIESYIGGTGLFSYTGVLKRGKDKFYSANRDPQADEFIPGGFFSLNGRGADQHAWWVTLQGQVYAVWLNGRFGMDRFYLLRPFSGQHEVPVSTVNYRYKMQQESSGDLKQSEHEQQQLFQALNSLTEHIQVAADNDGLSKQAICPIPEGTDSKQSEAYYHGRPLHYSLELVSHIPVWIDSQCYIGTVVSYFSYTPGKGATLEIAIDSPREDDEAATYTEGYTFSGLRRVVSVTTGQAVRSGDNGI